MTVFKSHQRYLLPKDFFFLCFYLPFLCESLFNSLTDSRRAAELESHVENLCPSVSLSSMLQFPFSLSFIPFFLASWCPLHYMGFNSFAFLLFASVFLLFIYAKYLPFVLSNQVSPSLFSSLLWSCLDTINGLSWPLVFRRVMSMGNTSKSVKESERGQNIYYYMAATAGTTHIPKVIAPVRCFSSHNSIICRFQKLFSPFKLSGLSVILYSWGTHPRIPHYSLWVLWILLTPLKSSLFTSLFEFS